MPMWISWINFKTQKRERIYNYHDPATDEGQNAIQVAKGCLAQRFDIPGDDIPGFRVEVAPWLPPEAREINPGG